MDLVMGAMGMLPSKLLELLNEEYKLQSGVRAQIESLSRELESTYVAISMVAQVPPEHLNPQVALWAREVREASYDMEDILDTFLVRVDGGAQPAADPDRVKRLMKKMGKLFNLSKVKARHDIARGIEGIEKKVKEIAERRARYRVDDLVRKRPAAITSDDDPRLPFLYKTKLSQLVGIHETRGAVIEMLSKNEDDNTAAANMETKIISIVGFGGLGKTTLAKAVYDKESPAFCCRAFVSVGRHPTKSKVLRDILIDLISNEAQEKSIDQDNKRHNSDFDVAELDAKQLIEKLRRFLDKKRYFIVIDDIWDISTWETISSAFVDNNLGSRIITTTRNSQVAAEIGDHVYRIKELSDSNSRKLFYTRIFGTEADKHPHNGELDEIASNIIRKCDGVPLAILAIASLLVTKPIKEWYNVYNSIGPGHGDNRQVQNMMKILSFSYYDLPCHLRTCLLYLSLFPDGYLFERNELIWRWIAEGLVHEETGKVPFEVGVSYFDELISRSMILPENEEEGLVLFCRVHDMVLHLLRDLSSKENFAAILDGEQLPVAQVGARRLAFHNLSKEEQNHQQLKGMGVQKVRSLNAIICRGSMIPPVSSFQVLRVLALIYCPGMDSHHFENVGKLHHLRYLGLSHTRADELPAEVGRLKFLQTLILDNTGIKELPATLRCLSQLMCLRADVKTRAPDWIGELTSLVELEIYPGADDTCFVKELGKLINLMMLKTRITARDEEQSRRLLESLSELQKIQTMDIAGGISNGFAEDVVMQPEFKLSDNLRVLGFTPIEFSRLPAWINYSLLPNLCQLTLHMPEVGEQDLEILGRFPELRSLTIFSPQDRAIRKPVIGGGAGFQKLRILFINFLMHFLHGAMTRIEGIWLALSVRQVKDNNLGTDIGLENLSSLEDVRVVINCLLAHPTEVDEVEAAVRHALDIHPNRPTRKLVRAREDGMVTGAEEESRMLTRQQYRRQDVLAQYKFWTESFQALCSAINEVLATIYEGHPSFIQRRAKELYQQLEETDERVHHELPQRTTLGADPELHQLIEDTEAIERAFKIIRVKYPLLVAMLEELKAKLNRQDAEEAETVAKHAADIHPHGLMLRLRIEEKRAKLRYRFQVKLIEALRGLVIQKTKMIHESDPIYAKVNQFIDHHNDTVQRANHELLLWDEDNDEEEHGLHQVIEDTAALERALKIYTDENPLLTAMMEELSAEVDQKEERDKKNPLYPFVRLSRELSEVCASIPDGHPLVAQINPFVGEFNNTMNRVLSLQDSGVDEVDERLEIYTVEYRRLSAMLEEVKAELKLQLEDDSVDNISECVPEEKEEPKISNLSID